MRRIDILVHAADNYGPHYAMYQIAELWKESGIDVRVIRGPLGASNADLAVLHVDITKIPIEYMAKARQYPRTINGYVADISKRLVSRNLVERPQDFDGPVIVKTNLNCGGSQEVYFGLLGVMPGEQNQEIQNYQIFESAAQVPTSIWSSRNWVVEKYLAERSGEFYCLRTWNFLGDRWTHNRSFSHEPIVKGHNTVRRENLGEIPDDLMALREELAFDFGKFDYAEVDGQVVLYDANRTPGLGVFSQEEYLPRARVYAKGLAAFL